MPMDPIDKKFEAFNWKVLKVDGHNIPDLLAAMREARDYNSARFALLQRP